MLSKFMGWALLGAIRLLTGAQARWWGCPPKAEQRIYFANHQSHIDLVMIWAALPEELRSITRPIAARDYWATSPFKHWITTEVFNAIYVERGGSVPMPADLLTPAYATAAATGATSPSAPSPMTGERIEPSFEPHGLAEQAPAAVSRPAPETQEEAPPPVMPGSAEALAPLQPLIDALQSGDSIIIFPEGTRGHTGVPQKFKSGLYTLARMFPEVVLVPAWIDNVQRVMPKGEVVPVPILCTVVFGAPLALGPGEERRAFLDRARAAVMALRDIA